MNKRSVFGVIVLVALLLVSATFAQETTERALAPWVCPKEFSGQTLNIFNWSTYIGETTIADFERLCGVVVTYDVYDSDQALLSRLRQGNPGYDIIVPSDYVVPALIREALLVPLALDQIPNFKHLNPEFTSSIYDPDNAYALPYLLGTFGIGYNINAVSGEVTSWTQFFTHDGPVAWADDGYTMIGLALLLNGFDPNSNALEEVAVAKQYLLDHSSNVVAIASDDGQEMVARGEVDMAIDYDGDFFQIMADCACEDFAYVIPEEGSGITSGFVAIPTGGQNPALAHAFIDYILNPQVAAAISNDVGYATPNKTAIDFGLIDEELLNNKGLYPDEITQSRLYFMLQDPDYEQLYLDTWDEIKVNVGK